MCNPRTSRPRLIHAWLLLLACLSLSGRPASAQLIASEGFAHPAGAALAGQDGGAGFASGWTERGTGTPSVIAGGGLTYPNLAVSGNALETTSDSSIGDDRTLAASYGTPGTTVYFSCLVRPLDSMTSGSPDTYFGFLINNVFVGKPGASPYYGIEQVGGAGMHPSGVLAQTGATVFLVARVTFTGANSVVDLFVNPPVGTALPSVPDAEKSDLAIPGSTLASIGASIRCRFDELRVGTSYAAVAPSASSWAAVSVSSGADGNTRLLWDKADGTATVWKVDSAGVLVTQRQFGPYAGWTARAIATGGDNRTRLLWTNADGAAAFYLLDPDNAFVSQTQYGPYAGWTAEGIAVEPDNTARALWTDADGTATVWTMDATNHLTGQQQYGPYTGWTARSVAASPDGGERLLWTNADGTATFWRLNGSSQFIDQKQYGPYTGYTAIAIASAPDGTGRVVWAGSDAHIALWTLDAGNAYTGQQSQFGPYAGWSFTGIGVGADGNARLLWDNISGQAALWSLTPGGAFADNDQYGPY